MACTSNNITSTNIPHLLSLGGGNSLVTDEDPPLIRDPPGGLSTAADIRGYIHRADIHQTDRGFHGYPLPQRISAKIVPHPCIISTYNLVCWRIPADKDGGYPRIFALLADIGGYLPISAADLVEIKYGGYQPWWIGSTLRSTIRIHQNQRWISAGRCDPLHAWVGT